MNVILRLGLGDLLCWESWLPHEEKSAIENVYLAGSIYLGEGCELLRLGRKMYAFTAAYGQAAKTGKFKSYPPCAGIPVAETITVTSTFPKLTKFYGSSALMGKERKMLDEPHKIIVPWSINGDKERNFDKEDWARCLSELGDCLGVVLFHGPDHRLPKHPKIRDESNKWTLADCVHWLRGAVGYDGIDSALACLACQLFDADHLRIKSVNKHYWDWIGYYCAPHQEYSFVYGKPVLELETLSDEAGPVQRIEKEIPGRTMKPIPMPESLKSN